MATPDPDSSSVERYSVKDLTQKMLEGENEFVMKYLKTLPKEECKETRARLIKNLEEIQKKKKNGTVGRSGRKTKDDPPVVPAPTTPGPNLTVNTNNSQGSVGKSNGESSSGTGRRKPKHRKHIETGEEDDDKVDKVPSSGYSNYRDAVIKEEDLEIQIRELTLERDRLKMQNQELKDKITQAQQAKKKL